jgi:hypothetical protein
MGTEDTSHDTTNETHDTAHDGGRSTRRDGRHDRGGDTRQATRRDAAHDVADDGRGVALAVGVALLLILALALAPAVAWVGSGAAWTLTALLVVAGLAVPTQRFRRWPAADRRAAVRSVVPALARAVVATVGLVLLAGLVMVLVTPGASPLLPYVWRLVLPDAGLVLALPVMVGALTVALREVTPRGWSVWAGRRGLDPDAPTTDPATLRRVRTWRTLPAVAGATIGLMPQALSNLMSVHGVGGDALRQRLQDLAATGPVDPLTLALLGTLLGAVAVEVHRAHRSTRTTSASVARLETRTPAAYLTPVARWLPFGLAGLAATLTVAARAAGIAATWWPAAAGVALTVGAVAVRHWIVGRPQRLVGAEATAVDDAFRSSAAHAVTGTTSALLLLLVVGSLQPLVVGPDGQTWGGAGIAVGFALVVGVAWSWFGYGSGHPGRTPARAPQPVAAGDVPAGAPRRTDASS